MSHFKHRRRAAYGAMAQEMSGFEKAPYNTGLPELDPRILLDTKKGLGAVAKFLDSLPQLLC